MAEFSLERELSMSGEEVVAMPATGYRYMTLVNREDPTMEGTVLSVPINHRQLDSLVGRLMQMCDLIGDVAQRKALKDTIKQISRDWLDTEYEDAGYDRFGGANGKSLKTVDASYYHFEQ